MSTKDFDEQLPVVQIGSIEINTTDFTSDPTPDDLPVLPTRNLVLFPGVTIPISLTRDNSLKVAKAAFERRIPIGIVCQVDSEEEKPTIIRGLHRYGVVADVYQVIELPDGSQTALVHGRERFRVLGKGDGQTMSEADLSVRVKLMEDTAPTNEEEFNLTIASITEIASEVSQKAPHGDMSFSKVMNSIKIMFQD